MIDETNVEEYLDALSVSCGDNIQSVSGNESAPTNIYIINQPPAETQQEIYTIWNKPLEEYNITETFLMIIVCILLIISLFNLAKGVIARWHSL